MGTVERADLAIAYCGWSPSRPLGRDAADRGRTAEILAQVSTNLDNLRAAPLASMLGSAFVSRASWVSPSSRPCSSCWPTCSRSSVASSVVVGLAGHVGAGLVVAVGLATGIFHGFVDESVAEATDVGVSYVMACAMGFLSSPCHGAGSGGTSRRRPVLACAGAFTRTFTDAGHATALAIGLLLALVASRAVASDHRSRARGERGIDTGGADGRRDVPCPPR